MSGTSRTGSTSGAEHYLAEFERFARQRTGDPGWLAEVRRSGAERFAALGFPTTRLEDWKYTNVGPITSAAYRTANGAGSLPSAAALARAAVGSDDHARLVIASGRFSPQLSSRLDLPAGARIGSLQAFLAEAPELLEPHLGRLAPLDLNGFAALGAAFLADGAFLHLPAGAVVPEPIEIVFLSSAGDDDVIAHPRLLVVMGENCQAEIVEVHSAIDATSGGNRLANATVEISLGAGARLTHVKLVREGASGSHVATTQVVQARDSSYRSSSFVLGARLARHDLRVLLEAEGASCSLDGLYFVDDGQLVDNHTFVDHARPHGTSREIYKGVLGGRARAVFNGRVLVREDAQKSDAQQTNRNLLLSERAEIDTKPQLEIFADDVKCSHGAAIGPPDPDVIFYLQSRGIAEPAARRMLTQGFAGEIAARIQRPTLRASLEAMVNRRIGVGSGAEEMSR